MLCSVAFATEAPPQPTTPTLAPPPGQHCDDGDQPLTDIPNADGEVAAPTRPAPAPPPARSVPAIKRGTPLAPPKPLTRVFGPATLPTDTVNTPAQPEAQFVESTRHHDCDLDLARFDDSGDYCAARPPAPRRHQQAVNVVLASLEPRKPFMHKGMGAAPGRH
jgi:hypothetical protein